MRDTASPKNLESVGKSALIGGVTGGALEYTGLNGDISKLSGTELYTTVAKKVIVEEMISTGISGGDPSKLTERIVQRTALAIAQHKVGDVGVAAKLPDGGIAKMALHGTVAGSFAQATGDKFVRGFAGGALGEFVGSKLYKGKGYKGYDPSRDIAGLSAGVTSMALGGSAKSMNRASQVSMSGHEYNTVAHAVRYGAPIAFDAALATEAVATTAMGASIIEARDTLSDTKAKLETAALQKVLDIGLGLIIPDTSSGPTVISTPIHEQKPQVFVTPPYQGPKVQLETYPESDSRFRSPVLPGFTAPAKEFKLPGYEAPTLPDMRIMYNKELLPGEGKVGSYADLISAGNKGDNIAAHHIPHNQYMKSKGVAKKDGISINVEHPAPGAGGRHREIHKKLQRQDTLLEPRDALAQGILRTREVYQQDGLYPQVRGSLQETIKQNKEKYPSLFKKEGTK